MLQWRVSVAKLPFGKLYQELRGCPSNGAIAGTIATKKTIRLYRTKPGVGFMIVIVEPYAIPALFASYLNAKSHDSNLHHLKHSSNRGHVLE